MAETKIETHLEKNLEKIEPGLKLIRRQFIQKVMGERLGIIDLMCQGEDGSAVVVELKSTEAGSREVGQALAYHKLMQERAKRYSLPKPRTYLVVTGLLPAAKLILDLLNEIGLEGFYVKLLTVPAGAIHPHGELIVDVYDYNPDLEGTLTVPL